MSTIDISKYNCTINNVTVNGNLTVANHAHAYLEAACSAASPQYIVVNNIPVIFGNLIRNSLPLTVSSTGSRYTYTGLPTALFQASASVALRSTIDSRLYFMKNSDTNQIYGMVMSSFGCTDYKGMSTAALIPMITGDYLECIINSNNGPLLISSDNTINVSRLIIQ